MFYESVSFNGILIVPIMNYLFVHYCIRSSFPPTQPKNLRQLQLLYTAALRVQSFPITFQPPATPIAFAAASSLVEAGSC